MPAGEAIGLMCDLNRVEFKGEIAGGAFLDANSRCLICGRFAGEHPNAPAPAPVATGN